MPSVWSANPDLGHPVAENRKGLRARGGYTVDIAWHEGQVTSYQVRSQRRGTVTVRYNGKEEQVLSR